MEILKIKIDADEEQFILKKLISLFDLERSDIFRSGQEVNFPLNETVEIYSELSIFRDKCDEPDENGQYSDPRHYVSEFTIDFCIDGYEIEVVRINQIGETIEDKIKNFYTK